MSVWGGIAVAFLIGMVVLIFRGVRGHARTGDTDTGLDGIGYSGTDGGGSCDGGGGD